MATPSHPIYSRDSTVYILSGDNKLETFHRAIEQSEFLADIDKRWRTSGKEKADFAIAIKPNIMTASTFEENSAVYTDPLLVEELIRMLREEGFELFSVVDAQNVYNYSYQGRTVPAVAEMCGFTGNGYSIVDLSEETLPYDYGSVIGEHRIGKVWHDADYRISFAKNKSHWQCYSTACIKNVYGCLPAWDKMQHYHGQGIEFYEASVLIADRFPVHFGFLDAWISGDGLTGHVRDPEPNETRTIIASNNIFALDWVASEKMQINPAHNYVLQEGMHRWGTIRIQRKGNMTPWHPWNNVRPFVVVGFNAFEEFYGLSRFMSRALASHMDKRFKPVSKWQWFFGIIQTLVRLFEGLATKKTSQDKRWRRPA